MRKLATIQVISEINPIPDADKIEVATILGWKVVVRKGEFKVGDKCIYFEIDSLIPIEPWSQFLEDKNKPGNPVRLKTVKLRKQISQGLAVPFEILENYIGSKYKTLNIGEDVTEIMKIEKWEPPIPACLSGEVKGPRPSYVKKTDRDRIQAFPELIEEFQGREVYITQKIDGASSTFVNMNDTFDVCGRNWAYKPDVNNTYLEICNKYEIDKKLKDIYEKTGQNYAIQGECYGEGIQKNRLGIKGHQLAVFDVINVDGHKYLDFYEFKEFCERLKLPTVPILKVCKFDWTSIEELLEEAKGNYANGQIQEGIVIVPIQGFYSEVLDGRATFKVINNDFLMKSDN